MCCTIFMMKGVDIQMAIEYELRMLEISVENMIYQLEKLGAQKKGVFHQKRYVYDFVPAQKGRWIRLRSNGSCTTLTIKEIKSLRIDGTNELEIIVSDFDETNRILHKLGYSPRTFQENFRIEYSLNGVNFDIDKWPKIPPYMEIEGVSEQAVLGAIDMLGIPHEKFITKDVDSIYHDIYGITLDEISTLKFSIDEIEYIKKYKK